MWRSGTTVSHILHWQWALFPAIMPWPMTGGLLVHLHCCCYCQATVKKNVLPHKHGGHWLCWGSSSKPQSLLQCQQGMTIALDTVVVPLLDDKLVQLDHPFWFILPSVQPVATSSQQASAISIPLCQWEPLECACQSGPCLLCCNAQSLLQHYWHGCLHEQGCTAWAWQGRSHSLTT
jgi:hypothetical protein